MKWFYMRGPGGTIACRGEYKAEAVTEAAERWGCDPAEIEVTGTEEYNGNGAHCAPLQKKDAAGAVAAAPTAGTEERDGDQ